MLVNSTASMNGDICVISNDNFRNSAHVVEGNPGDYKLLSILLLFDMTQYEPPFISKMCYIEHWRLGVIDNQKKIKLNDEAEDEQRFIYMRGGESRKSEVPAEAEVVKVTKGFISTAVCTVIDISTVSHPISPYLSSFSHPFKLKHIV
jgi:hypothetical protein